MLHPSFPIETERLVLRPFEEGDYDWFVALRRDKAQTRYVPFGGESEDEIKDVLQRRKKLTQIESPGDGIMCVMVERASGEPVGEVMLRYAEGFQNTGEVGFIVQPQAQGKGFATEGALAMMRLGFEGAGFHRMIGLCDGENAASLATLRRIGMMQEGLMRKAIQKDGEWRDQAIFAMTADEWRAR